MLRRLLLLPALSCAFLTAIENQAPAQGLPESLAVSSLKYEAFEGKEISRFSTLLLWSLGKGIRGRTGGSLAVLKSESREYLGWIDEAGEIQAALDAGSLQRDLTGDRVLLDFQSFTGASLYLRRSDALERVPQVIQKEKTKVVDNGAEHPASYYLFTGRQPGPHGMSLLTIFGIAFQGQQSRIQITVMEDGKPYDRTAILSGSGKVERIVERSWGIDVPPAATAK